MHSEKQKVTIRVLSLICDGLIDHNRNELAWGLIYTPFIVCQWIDPEVMWCDWCVYTVFSHGKSLLIPYAKIARVVVQRIQWLDHDEVRQQFEAESRDCVASLGYRLAVRTSKGITKNVNRRSTHMINSFDLTNIVEHWNCNTSPKVQRYRTM